MVGAWHFLGTSARGHGVYTAEISCNSSQFKEDSILSSKTGSPLKKITLLIEKSKNHIIFKRRWLTFSLVPNRPYILIPAILYADSDQETLDQPDFCLPFCIVW